jgi:hypothetical protein
MRADALLQNWLHLDVSKMRTLYGEEVRLRRHRTSLLWTRQRPAEKHQIPAVRDLPSSREIRSPSRFDEHARVISGRGKEYETPAGLGNM